MAERLRICMRVHGLAVDDNGEPADAGLQMDFGKSSSKNPISYEKLVAALNVEAFLQNLGLDKAVSASDVEFITPEEYDSEFGPEGARQIADNCWQETGRTDTIVATEGK